MGNRAVITTEDGFKNPETNLGVYLHWHGGRDSVEAFLAYCKLREFRPPENDCYGWARFCQVVGNFFGGDLSIGIDTVAKLDCDNGDNGTYLIKNWQIVGREYGVCREQKYYDFEKILLGIDAAQPEQDRLGAAVIEQYVAELSHSSTSSESDDSLDAIPLF